MPDDDDGMYSALMPARRAVCSHTRWNAVPIENEPTVRLRVLLSRTKSCQVLIGLSAGTMKMNGVRATSATGCRSFCGSKGRLSTAKGTMVTDEATTMPSV